MLKNRKTGCDAYYFLLTVDAFKKQRRIPIRLPPYYLLDASEQWYPPGFTIFLSLFSKRILDRVHFYIGPLLDSLNGLMLGLLLWTIGVEWIGIIGGMLVYAIIPAVVLPTTSLNSRPLGNLLFTLTFLSLLIALQQNPILAWLGFVIFGFMLLMTHKLTMQELVMVCGACAVVFLDLRYVLALAGLFLFTLTLSGGFYYKVLLGQREILWFWRKYWPFWEAHQVYDSPIYGKHGQRKLFYGNTPTHYLRYARILLAANPFLILVPFLTAGAYAPIALAVIGASALIAVLTLIIPGLRFLGEGEKYLKYTAFPTAYLVGTHLPTLIDFSGILLAIAAALCITSLTIKYRKSKRNYSRIDSDLHAVFAFVRRKHLDRIMCIPVFFADALMHHGRCKVLWGSHSGGFHKLQEFFPVLQKPLSYFKKQYRLSCVILNTDYVNPKALHLTIAHRLFVSGPYCIYRL